MTPPRQPGIAAIAACLLALCACANSESMCVPAEGVNLQVLGSGGPIADDARSSTAYVVWVDGKSRILVDFGGGAFLRFGEAGARYDDIDHIAISHFHTDHSADLVTLLKTGSFSKRERDLGISGPTAGGPFPGLDRFLQLTIGKDGAYAYLSGYLDGSGQLPLLRSTMLDARSRESMPVVGDADSDIQIEAIGVPHGIVPTIGYRIRVGDRVIVFASDQNGNDATFTEFARDADLLVMHMPVPENVSGGGRQLHAPPSRLGEIASNAGAKSLLVSHFMARSLRELDGNVELIRDHYDGKIILASDLQCISIAANGD